MLGFRHDPFMLHQANARSFSYNDPTVGATRDTSLLTLFTERVVKKVNSFWNIPSMLIGKRRIRFNFVFQFKLTEWRISHNCGSEEPPWTPAVSKVHCKSVMAKLLVSRPLAQGMTSILHSNILTFRISSCVVGISGLELIGSTVSMERVGTETTAWIKMTANTPQTLALATPIDL